jgi:hypothetical protein
LCSIVHSRPIVLRAVDFSITKNPTASVGSEPAILGSRGQRFDPRTVQPVACRYTDWATRPTQLSVHIIINQQIA